MNALTSRHADIESDMTVKIIVAVCGNMELYYTT